VVVRVTMKAVMVKGSYSGHSVKKVDKAKNLLHIGEMKVRTMRPGYPMGRF
jgi:hypothetical protein